TGLSRPARPAGDHQHFIAFLSTLSRDTTDAPMGGVGADPVAVLDGGVPGPHSPGPYHHPHDHRSVLCEPGGHTRCPTRPGPTRVSHVYSTFWECPQSQSPFSLCLPRGGLSRSH